MGSPTWFDEDFESKELTLWSSCNEILERFADALRTKTCWAAKDAALALELHEVVLSIKHWKNSIAWCALKERDTVFDDHNDSEKRFRVALDSIESYDEQLAATIRNYIDDIRENVEELRECLTDAIEPNAPSWQDYLEELNTSVDLLAYQLIPISTYAELILRPRQHSSEAQKIPGLRITSQRDHLVHFENEGVEEESVEPCENAPSRFLTGFDTPSRSPSPTNPKLDDSLPGPSSLPNEDVQWGSNQSVDYFEFEEKSREKSLLELSTNETNDVLKCSTMEQDRAYTAPDELLTGDQVTWSWGSGQPRGRISKTDPEIVSSPQNTGQQEHDMSMGTGMSMGMLGMIDPNLDQASFDLIKQLQQEDLGLRRRSR